MKKITAILLLLCLTLTGCGGNAAPAPTPEPTPAPTPEPTAAEDLPWTLDWNGTEYTGVYSGAVEHMIPQGEGAFIGRSGPGRIFSWDGGWIAGLPSGEGEMTDESFHTRIQDVPCAGTYRGGAADGLPTGAGSFASVTAEGVPFAYEGGWKDGLPEGEGTLTYDAEGYFTRAGRFTAGRFTPNWIQALETVGTCEPCFTLSDEQRAFLEEHPELWESDEHLNFLESEYKKDYVRGLTMADCFERPEVMDQPGWMCIYSLRLIRAWTVDGFDGVSPMTVIVAADGTYSMNVRVILPAVPEYTYRGQRFHVYALPVGLSEYTNVLGEKQTCLVLVAGDAYFGQ